MEIRAQWQPWYGGIAVLMRVKKSDGIYVVPPSSLQLEKISPDTFVEPTMILDREEAQLLLDELYQCGFRASSGEHTTGQLAATEKHLEDMRKIAFKYLDAK